VIQPAPPLDLEALLTHAPFLHRLARSLVADASRADDLVQETWLAVLSSPGRGVRAARAFLAGVARNLARVVRRSEGRRTRREREAARGEAVLSAGDVIEREELRYRVVREVLALAEPSRTAVLLRFYEGLPPREIARRLCVPVGTAKTRLKRGLQELRERLDAAHGGERSGWVRALLPLAGGGAGIVGVGLALRQAAKLAAAALVVGGTLVAVRPRAAPPAPGGSVPRGTAAPAAVVAAGPADGAARESPGAASGAPAAADVPAVAETFAPIQGVVLDPESRPVAGARVSSHPERAMFATMMPALEAREAPVPLAWTDAGGRFSVPVAAGGPVRNLFAEAPGFAPGVGFDIRPGGEATVRLRRGRTLAGRVTDEAGRPIGGARVRWTGHVHGIAWAREAETDRDGSYRIDQLPARALVRGGWYVEAWFVEARAEGYAAQVRREHSLPPGWFSVRTVDHFALGRGAPLSGRVVDAQSGDPLGGAHVLLWTGPPWGGSDHVRGVAGFGFVLDETKAAEGGVFLFEHASLEAELGAYAPDHVPTSAISRDPEIRCLRSVGLPDDAARRRSGTVLGRARHGAPSRGARSCGCATGRGGRGGRPGPGRGRVLDRSRGWPPHGS